MSLYRSVAGAIFVALLAAIVPGAASAQQTIGNPLVTGSVDGSSNFTFIVNQPFTMAGNTVTNYSFYAGNADTVIPLLFSANVGETQTTFTVIGRGASQQATTGINTFAFNLASGSNTTVANTYFGIFTPNAAVVDFNYGNSGVANTYETVNSNTNMVGSSYTFTVSNNPNNTNGLSNRLYSVMASTTAAPEPTSWALMVGGFGMAGGMLRRRGTRGRLRTA